MKPVCSYAYLYLKWLVYCFYTWAPSSVSNVVTVLLGVFCMERLLVTYPKAREKIEKILQYNQSAPPLKS